MTYWQEQLDEEVELLELPTHCPDCNSTSSGHYKRPCYYWPYRWHELAAKRSSRLWEEALRKYEPWEST